MAELDLFQGCYRGRKVLVTGHRGFKGSWLVLWLHEMGADVLGLSNSAFDTTPHHFSLLNEPVATADVDIRDRDDVLKVIADFQHEMVFHVAAQPLVRLSYEHPLDTFEPNIMGSLNVYHACRQCDSVRAIVSITSDKVYDNIEHIWRYREIDPLGGKDPYSASKGAAEIVTASYRHSFFHPDDYGSKHHILLATGRAGNVIGGGDWSADRLIPDAMIASSKNEELVLRSPNAVRPWQHVLDALYGYLLLGQKLLAGDKSYAEPFNFGPQDSDSLTVEAVVKCMVEAWPSVHYRIDADAEKVHEAGLLTVDSTKAKMALQWHPAWDTHTAIDRTVAWYRDYYEQGVVNSLDDLIAFTHCIAERQESL